MNIKIYTDKSLVNNNKVEKYSCLKDANEKVKNKCVIINNSERKEIIKLLDIIYIEAGTKGTVVRISNAIYFSKNSLKSWEECMVNYPFYRCHKSYIVNLSYVDTICKDYAVLKNSERVMISRRRHKDFELQLIKYISIPFKEYKRPFPE